jgi:hypothetical protein
VAKLPWARQNGDSFITLTMDRSWFNSRREDAPTKAHYKEFDSDGQRQPCSGRGEFGRES